MKSQTNQLPYIAAAVTAVIFGFSFLFTKSALGFLSTFQLLGLRFMSAALLLSVLNAFGIIKVRIPRSNLKDLLLIALFQPVLYFVFETVGVGLTTASISGIIIALVPISITLFAVGILKERLGLFQWIFISVSVAGVILIVLAKGDNGGSGNLAGIAALIGAVLAAGPYNVLSRKISSKFKPVEITFVMMWVGAVVFNLIGVTDTLLRGNLANYLAFFSTPLVILDVVYLGIVSSVGAFFLLNYALSKMEASKSAIFMNLTPVITVAAGILLRGEKLYFLQCIGAVLILAGIWGANRKFKAKQFQCAENSLKV